MKVGKQFRLVLGAAVILSLSSVVGVAAIARQDGTPIEAGEDGIMLMSTTADTVKTTITERLAQRKAALTTKLTNAQTTRLKARCQAAQVKLQAVSQRAITADTRRSTAYKNIQDTLATLVERVGDQADTTELEAALTALGTNVTAYETAATNYKQTLADLGELDCVADPTAFKASLESAKTEQSSMKDAAVAVRAQLQDTIKPLLEALKLNLKAGGTN
jgi:hypothetical protein